jgi:Cellulase (glycosyl hydrolase family 5)
MRRLTILATLLAVLALGLGTAGTANAQGGGGLPPSFYGVIPIQLMSFEEFQKMKAGGVGTLRFPVIWRDVEPNADDQYDWSRIDYQIYNASLVGAEVMPFFYSTPKWATSGGCSTATKCQSVPPTSSQKTMEAFQDFLKDFADRYGVNGTFWNDPNDQFDPPFVPVRQYQIWNEPSSPTYWNKPNAEQYAQVVKASHDTITAVDPDARILLAGLFGTPQGDASSKNVMWKYLARFYGAGASDSFDAVALHPYSPDVKGLRFQLNKARKILDKHGDQDKEILVSEIGWSSAKPKEDRPLIKGKKGQAKLLTKSYNFLLKNRGKYNIGSIIWYAWADADHDIAGCEFCNTAGLFKLNGQAKKSWTALVKITGGTP